jgi:hypothetical protein
LKSYKDGYAAYEVRKKIREGGESNYKLDLGDKLWSIQNYEIKNTQTTDKPLEEVCDVSIDEYVIKANDKIYFNPHLFLRKVKILSNLIRELIRGLRRTDRQNRRL